MLPMSVDTITSARHGLFQLAQHLARVQVGAAVEGLFLAVLVDHVQAVRVALVGPVVELLFPRGLLGLDLGGALGLGGVAGQRAARQALGECHGGGLGVAADADRDLLHQAEHGVVGVDLDDLGILGPVVHAVLRQGAEGAEPAAQRDHHVGLGDQLHRRLRALVAERAAPQRVAGGEGVVVQVAIHHRRAQALGQRLAFLDAVGHHHAAAGDDDGELGRGQQLGGFVEGLLAARAAVEAEGLGISQVMSP
jgi:hypothetical protein